MMDWLDFANDLEPLLRQGDLDTCISKVSDVIRGIPTTAWHLVLNVDFANKPQELAEHFDRFFLTASEKLTLKALYTETNGFYINPDRWYFEIWGHDTYKGHQNYDWLAYPQAQYEQSITLIGMERLQKIYESETKTIEERNARDYADLLVVLRFQKLIERSAALMQKVTVPILATAHDYDFIAEIKPPQHSYGGL